MNIQNMFSLKDRVILITGATSGIGRATAIACAQAGAVVAAIGRSQEKLDSLRTELSRYGNNFFLKSFDVTEYDRIPEVIAEVVENCGKIGGFVHSAGISEIVPLSVMSPQVHNEIYSVNAIAGFEFIKVLSKKRSHAEKLSVVMYSSVSAIHPATGILAYSMSKGAVLSGVRALAVELAPKGIRINAIVPGFVAGTEIINDFRNQALVEAYEIIEKHHLFGIGNPDSIACGTVYLLAPASEWMTGTELVIDGGYCLG